MQEALYCLLHFFAVNSFAIDEIQIYNVIIAIFK